MTHPLADHRREWRVIIRTWDVYEITVRASSAAVAEEMALFEFEQGDEREHSEGGVESVHAIEGDD
jgi:hypothetical protein